MVVAWPFEWSRRVIQGQLYIYAMKMITRYENGKDYIENCKESWKYMITFEFETALGPMTKAFMTDEPTHDLCKKFFAFLTDSFGPFVLTDVQICEIV